MLLSAGSTSAQGRHPTSVIRGSDVPSGGQRPQRRAPSDPGTVAGASKNRHVPTCSLHEATTIDGWDSTAVMSAKVVGQSCRNP